MNKVTGVSEVGFRKKMGHELLENSVYLANIQLIFEIKNRDSYNTNDP